MIAAEIIAQVLDAGGQVTADGADLVLTAPRPLSPDLLDQIKAHKLAILEVLAAADDNALWWRVAITEAGGRTIEVDTPGYTLTDWQAYAARYHGHGCAVTPIAPLPKPRDRSTSMRPYYGPPARTWRASRYRSSGRSCLPGTSRT